MQHSKNPRTLPRPWWVLAISMVLIGALTVLAPAAPAIAETPTEPTWTPPPGALPDAPSALYVVSEPWGSLGRDTYTATNDRADLDVIVQTSRVAVIANGDRDAYLLFGIPPTGRLSTGFRAYADDRSGSLHWTFDGSGCSDGSGWVDVTRADYVADVVDHVELTFERSCKASGGEYQVHHGALKWDRNAPDGTPNPVAMPDDLWQPPTGALPGTDNAGYIESGIPIIDGVTATDTGVSGYDDLLDPEDLRGDGWRFQVGTGDAGVQGEIQAGRHDDQLREGLYTGIFTTGINGVTGGLNLSYGSHAMGSCPSWFAIDELSRSNGHIDHIAFRFEHDCRPLGQVTRGAVRWTAKPTITTVTPNHGISRGGTKFRIQGIDLVDFTQVTVGGVAAARVPNTFDTFIAPALPVGDHEVRASVAGGVAIGEDATGYAATPNTPTAPRNLIVEPAPTRAVVTWDPPADIGASRPTAVRLELRLQTPPRSDDEDPTPPARVQTVGGSDTIALWGDLEPGRGYWFTVTYINDQGPGDVATSTQIRMLDADPTPFDGVPTLVTQQFVDFVGRAPTSAERNAGVDAIRSRKTSPQAFVASMRSRPEWGGVRGPVTRLYSSYFDRLPDSGGLTYWSTKLRSGMPLAKVSATFAASREFQTKYGTVSNGAFVDLIYRNVLHRKPDSSGRTYWIRKLNAGAARGAVMSSFSESSEHVRTMMPTVDTVLLYTAMLRRMPTGAELPATPGTSLRATTSAAAPDVDPTKLAEAIRRSPAYAERF